MYFTESLPDCVPEYYRSRREEQDRQYEREMQAQAHYIANRAKIAAAIESGLPVLTLNGHCPCWECRMADHDTMTAADDDFDRVICLDPGCQHQRRST